MEEWKAKADESAKKAADIEGRMEGFDIKKQLKASEKELTQAKKRLADSAAAVAEAQQALVREEQGRSEFEAECSEAEVRPRRRAVQH